MEKGFLGGGPQSEERVNWRGSDGGGDADDDEEGASTASRSNTWFIGRHCCSFSDSGSGVERGRIIFLQSWGESSVFELTEAGGDGGRV